MFDSFCKPRVLTEDTIIPLFHHKLRNAHLPALRIRKITSEPLKISATLRLLADLHFSKEENMHAALFYEECSFQLKEYDMNDPHLPLVLIDLARTKDRLGEYSESMNFFEEALSLYERSLDHDDDRIASLQYEMGVSKGCHRSICLSLYPFQFLTHTCTFGLKYIIGPCVSDGRARQRRRMLSTFHPYQKVEGQQYG